MMKIYPNTIEFKRNGARKDIGSYRLIIGSRATLDDGATPTLLLLHDVDFGYPVNRISEQPLGAIKLMYQGEYRETGKARVVSVDGKELRIKQICTKYERI